MLIKTRINIRVKAKQRHGCVTVVGLKSSFVFVKIEGKRKMGLGNYSWRNMIFSSQTSDISLARRSFRPLLDAKNCEGIISILSIVN